MKKKNKKEFGHRLSFDLKSFQKSNEQNSPSKSQKTKKAKKEKSQPKPSEEDDYFFKAMSGVDPIADIAPITESPLKLLSERAHFREFTLDSDDEGTLSMLDALVEGKSEFDISYSGEHVEGGIQGFDSGIIKKLKNGEYAWQAHLDLNGLTIDEARSAAREFVEEARIKSQRCLLFVHGGELDSSDKDSFLRNQLIDWITKGFLQKKILAFSTARPHDGGVGATYVLLRHMIG